MVVFTCQHCGESLKKKDVEKHYFGRCRGPVLVTCVDCLKDFREDYSKHFLCISEDSRYGVNGLKNNTLTKQQKWVMLVHETCNKALAENNLDRNTKALLEYMLEYPSIPDKEKPFRNFVKNLRKYPENTSQSVWEILWQAKTEEAKRVAESKSMIKNREAQNGNADEPTEKSSPQNSNFNETSEIPDEHNVTEKNVNGQVDDVVDDSKKKKKRRSESATDSQENENLGPSQICQTSEANQNVSENLTKKEKKERKKRLKYEAELQEISKENSDMIEGKIGENLIPDDQDTDKGSKKKGKKRKYDEKLANNEDSTFAQNGTEAGKVIKKKSKKQRYNDDLSNETEDLCGKNEENSTEPQNVDGVQYESNGKFSWESTIMQLLQSKDNEMSLKRLSKRVINEYLVFVGDAHVDEAKIGAKFHKKLSKMHNIIIHKDKVKVKTSRD